MEGGKQLFGQYGAKWSMVEGFSEIKNEHIFISRIPTRLTKGSKCVRVPSPAIHVPLYVQVPPGLEHKGEEMMPEYPVPQESVPEVPAALVDAVPPVVTMWDVAPGRRQLASI